MRWLRRPFTLLLFLAVLGSSVYAFANNHHGVFRGFPIVNLVVNGRVVRGEVPAINFHGRTMVPVRFVSEALGATVGWDEATWTASITLAGAAQLDQRLATANARIAEFETALAAAVEAAQGLVRDRRVLEEVDPYGPIIDLAMLGIPAASVEAFRLEKRGDSAAAPLLIDMTGNNVSFRRPFQAERQDGNLGGWQTDFVGFAGGSNILELNCEYILRVYTTLGQRYRIAFKTGGLPRLANDSRARQVILIPAMPERGFHWPYLLAIPNTDHRAANLRHRRHLLIDIVNTGPSSSLSETLGAAKDFITRSGYPSVFTAHALWTPLLMPVFPRPHITLPNPIDGPCNTLYTHGLDRDSAILHLKMQDPNRSQDIVARFAAYNLDAHDFKRLDLQVLAMIDHALEYLNPQGFNLERKVFLRGFSASGTFVDRFAMLHPERVRAVFSGATLDDMILPLAEYRGQQLIFPIGIYDYEQITGRPFSLQHHNQVARLTQMGEIDTADVLPFSDCYGDRERRIITELWGTDMLARAQQLIALYGRSGGEGIFILDKGVGHAESHAMHDYVIQFFKANRDSDAPVYVRPSDPKQLVYTLFGTATEVPVQFAGVISGAVRDAAGNPAARIFISVRDTETGEWRGHAWTTQQGNYTIRVPVGTYEMALWSPPGGPYLAPASRRDIAVTADVTTRADVTLEAGGRVTGRVTDAAGAGVVGAAVRVGVWGTETDALGWFTTVALAAGTYEMRVDPPPGGSLAGSILPGVVIVPGATTTRNVALPAGR